MSGALALRALLDTLPPDASEAERAQHAERRLCGAMLIAVALGDLALIRSVFFRFQGE